MTRRRLLLGQCVELLDQPATRLRIATAALRLVTENFSFGIGRETL